MKPQIKKVLKPLISQNGLYETALDEVKIFTTDESSPRTQLIYDLCLVIVLEGKKVGYLGENIYNYDNQNYIVAPATIPFECETVASKEEPFTGVIISIDKDIMIDILNQLEIKKSSKEKFHGLFTDSITPQIEETTIRLLQALHSQEEAKILGKQLLRELYYRIAIGKNAELLQRFFLSSKKEAKIAKSLKTIHENYNRNLDIPTLAKQEDMSVASFHTHFKKITSSTPLQYIKKIRLNKAKELITRYNYPVNKTADAIGYESPSQFSRDFKSFFGVPPKEAKASYEEYSFSA